MKGGGQDAQAADGQEHHAEDDLLHVLDILLLLLELLDDGLDLRDGEGAVKVGVVLADVLLQRVKRARAVHVAASGVGGGSGGREQVRLD